MIDKNDLRVPARTPFSGELQPTIKLLQYGSAGSFHPSRFYQQVGSLRESHGIDAILHLGYKYGSGDHKLEIVDAGKKTLSEQAAIVTRVFDVDPDTLELMRVDLTADVPGIPVSWFRANARFQFKQFASDINKAGENELEFIGMGSAFAQSLYAGRRPNCMRIYDKYAELYRQWLKLKRAIARYNRGLVQFDLTMEQVTAALRHTPTFDEFCLQEGFKYEAGTSLTRMERQIGGDRFPPQLRTFRDLKRAHEYNPFQSLQMASTGPIVDFEHPPKNVPIREWLASIGYQHLAERLGGIQHAQAFVTKYGNGNGKRVLESLQEHMPISRPPVTVEEIVANYRESTKKQIFENRNPGIYSGAEYEQANEKAEAATA